MSLGRASLHGVSGDTVGWNQVPVDPCLAHSWIHKFRSQKIATDHLQEHALALPRAVSWGVLPISVLDPALTQQPREQALLSRRAGGRAHWVCWEASWMSFLGHQLRQGFYSRGIHKQAALRFVNFY